MKTGIKKLRVLTKEAEDQADIIEIKISSLDREKERIGSIYDEERLAEIEIEREDLAADQVAARSFASGLKMALRLVAPEKKGA